MPSTQDVHMNASSSKLAALGCIITTVFGLIASLNYILLDVGFRSKYDFKTTGGSLNIRLFDSDITFKYSSQLFEVGSLNYSGGLLLIESIVDSRAGTGNSISLPDDTPFVSPFLKIDAPSEVVSKQNEPFINNSKVYTKHFSSMVV